MRPGRLYHRIYLSLLVVALLSIIGAGIVSHALLDNWLQSPATSRLQAEAEYVARALPPSSSSPEELVAMLQRLAEGLRLELFVFDQSGAVLASTTSPAPKLRRPPFHVPHQGTHWMLTSRGHALAVPLGDGRLLAVQERGTRSFIPLLAVFFGLLAALSLPVARRLTRRLEALEQGVARFGSGQLATRVPVDGRDEIALLAERFNWSAERIERLVEAQRRVLLSASHELRSPLARLRLGLELVRDSGGAAVADRVGEMVREVNDLDALVDDVLLASRLETQERFTAGEDVDLAALVAEESARVGAQAELTPAVVRGDARLLRRLVRNLLENAVRHGGGPLEAGVACGAAGPRLWVADRGPGVPVAEQERIFEPFYRSASAAADATPGVGLGLALVRQIAAYHGGQASCRTREGGGTLFEVVLDGGKGGDPGGPPPTSHAQK